jgi:hypothetical protein
MLMIPSRGQSVACKGVCLSDHFVHRFVELAQVATFFLFAPELVVSPIALDGFHSGN